MPIANNTSLSRFELEVEGQIAFADYRREEEKLVITHVEAPVALRGTGAAGNLMQGIVDYAKAEGLTIVSVCPYAVKWLARHPQ